MVNNNIQHKSTSFKLSDQVKELLSNMGFSFAFNWADFKDYKKQCINAFNVAYAIAECFVVNADLPSDYEDYLF
jgi:hypothetical protein